MATYSLAKDRNDGRNIELRQGWTISAYNREDGVLKFTDGKGYVCEGEIDAAKYALGLGAELGDIIYVGTMAYKLVAKDEPQGTITMDGPKCPAYRTSPRYTVIYRAKGESKPREPRQPREPRKVQHCEAPQPQPVAEPVAQPTTAPNVPSVDDIQALLNQMAQQAVAAKQAELDDVSAKYAAQCLELQNKLDEIAALKSQLQAAVDELNKAKSATGIVPFKGSKGKIKHAQYEEVMCYIQQGRNVLLLGKAGTGKTELAKSIAESLGIEYVSTGALVDKSEVTGYISPSSGKLIETCFYIAMKYGKLLLLDEFDCSFPEAAKYANEITANRRYTFPNGEVVEAHPNFRIVACANTNGEGATAAYNAAFKIDASTKDRFEMIEVEYMYEIDLLAAGGQLIDGKVIGGDEDLVEFAREMRELFNRDKMNNTYVMSPRRISGIYAGLPLGVEKAVRNGILNHMNADDARRIVGNLTGCTKYHEAARSVVANF